MKYVYIMVLIIAIGVLGLLYYQSSINQENTPTPSPTQSDNLPSENTMEPNTTEDMDLQAGGSSFADPKGVFTVLYPNDYVQDVEGNGQYTRIYKRGEMARPQSEMSDGVIMVFEVIELNNQSLEELVDSNIQASQENATITETKKAITVNGYPGFTYTSEGLGSSVNTYIQKDANSPYAVGIIYSVMDPENVGYQTQVNGILNNITLLK